MELEHSAYCEPCDRWATITEHEARHKMEDFEVVTLHDDGTADYKCCDCGTTTRSEMDERECED